MRTLTRPSASKALRHSPLVAAIGLAFTSMGVGAAPFLVTNNLDFGVGSLRDAISQANAACVTAPHVIEFSGPFTISPSTPLPAVTCPQVTINANQRTDVTVSGQFAYGGSCGITSSASTVVHKLTIRDFADGTGLCGSVHALNNVVANNQRGMNIGTGAYAYGNQLTGNTEVAILVSDAPTIEFNTITAPPGADGITTQFGYGGAIIRDNNITGGFYGIVAYDAPEVKRNTVQGADYGISVNGAGMMVQANVLRDNVYIGIIANDGATIDGNFVTGSFTGIEASQVTVSGNYVGSVAGGLPNDLGVVDYSFGYGGATIRDNVISGNTGTGLLLEGYGGTVRGNLIGTNAEGALAVPNAVGILVDSAAYGYLIDDNTVSGNLGTGIYIDQSFEMTITNNRVGTTSTGNAAVPNGSTGIDLPCGGDFTVFQSNLVSGNAQHGIALAGFQGNASNGFIAGNRIGVAGTGLNPAAIPNEGNGLHLDVKNALMCFGAVDGLAKAKAVGPRKARLFEAKLAKKALAGATAKALVPKAVTYNFDETNLTPIFGGNMIAYNRGAGIALVGGQGNYWLENRIWGNGGKNIDIAAGPADPLDADGGPNLKQNAPVITEVRQTVDGDTQIAFKLESEAGETCPAAPPPSGYVYRIDFFENAGASVPAGQFAILGANTFINGNPCGGEVLGGFTIRGLHDFISVTARNESSTNSSEFSGVVAAVAAPAVDVAPASFAFGNVPVGTTGTRTVTLTSVGGQPYQVASFSSDSTCGRVLLKAALPVCTAPFSCDTTCAPETSYANGASCSVTATFTPSGLGNASQTIYLCDNAHTSGHPLVLSGDGIPAPVATLAPASWDFGSVRAGTKSTFKSFSVVNENTVAVTIASIAVSGDFVRESTTCPLSPATLAPGAGCEVLVSFLPTGSGPVSGTLTVAAGGGGFSSATAGLQGSGVQVAEIVLPASMDFGTYTVGAAPIVRTHTFTNTGNVDVVFSSITATAPFTLANGCSAPLAPGASCTLSLSFAPTAPGSFSGTLAVSSNASGGSGNVPLTGTAQAAPAPLASFSATALNLGTAAIGSTTDAATITVTSNGTAPYVVSRYTTDASCAPSASVCGSGEFLCSLGCDPSVAYAPGASCTISARFSPQALGVRTTKFYVCDNTTSSPRAITLTGEGINPAIVDMAPSSQAFGTVQIGQSSEPRAFTVVNAGGRPATISAPLTTGSFRILSHNCPATLNASQRCVVNVVFTPTFAGAATGQLIIQAGAGSAMSSALATLTGIGGSQPVLELPDALDFGSVQSDGGTATRIASLSNGGNSPLAITSVTVSGTGFTLQNDCPSTVAPGASCSLRVTFTATSSGEFTGTLTVVGNAAGGPRTVPLVARAQPRPVASIRVSPGNMGFGDRQIGSQSAAQRITVSNVGGAAASIERMTLGPDYVVASNTCTGSVAAQQSCVIEVALRPVGFGSRFSQLLIFTSAEGSPHTVNLSGTGCRPFSAIGRGTGRDSACAP